MAEQLDFETLVTEFRQYLPPEAAHKMERLIHTHVGGPMTTLFTQMELTRIIMQRKPDDLPQEIEKLKENISFASENIRTIVRALAAATRTGDEDD